jgi:hypothetical protein
MSQDLFTSLASLDADFMPEQCEVWREMPGTINPDGSQGPSSTVVTAYACRVAPLGNSPVEQVIAARLTDVTGFLVTLPFNTDVTEKDAIHYGTQVLQVLGVLNPQTYQTSVKAACRRIS